MEDTAADSGGPNTESSAEGENAKGELGSGKKQGHVYDFEPALEGGLDFVFQDWINPRLFTDHSAETFTFDLNVVSGVEEDSRLEISQGEFCHTPENDLTGAVVWDDAVMLCRYACTRPELLKGKSVVDLGCGSGFLGIGVAAGCGANAVLTDRPMMRALITENARKNASVVASGGGKAVFAAHSWGEPLGSEADASFDDEDLLSSKAPFDVCLASGCVYHEEANPLLLDSLEMLCSSKTLILFAIDFRFDVSTKDDQDIEDDYITPVVRSFLNMAKERGLVMNPIPQSDLSLPAEFIKKSVRIYNCAWMCK